METKQPANNMSASGTAISVNELFEENIIAKIIKTAISGLENNVRIETRSLLHRQDAMPANTGSL